jgi:hypothetical protein
VPTFLSLKHFTRTFFILAFSNHAYKIIILPTLVITIPNSEIFLFCQHNLTGGGNFKCREFGGGW